jgi:hypothetical protein
LLCALAVIYPLVFDTAKGLFGLEFPTLEVG